MGFHAETFASTQPPCVKTVQHSQNRRQFQISTGSLERCAFRRSQLTRDRLGGIGPINWPHMLRSSLFAPKAFAEVQRRNFHTNSELFTHFGDYFRSPAASAVAGHFSIFLQSASCSSDVRTIGVPHSRVSSAPSRRAVTPFSLTMRKACTKLRLPRTSLLVQGTQLKSYRCCIGAAYDPFARTSLRHPKLNCSALAASPTEVSLLTKSFIASHRSINRILAHLSLSIPGR